MKGFKPTGYGPSAGFTFPSRMGFTGSTGRVTNVQPYVRRKHFANGGFVREDTPRMKEETIGDQGSSMVRRKRAYAKWQDDSGAHSSLLPGYKDGGANWIKGAIKKPGALHQALGVPKGEKIPAKKLAQAANSSNPTMRRRAALAKTLKKMHKAKGGAVSMHEKAETKKHEAMEESCMKKADGGSVPRRTSNPSVWEGIKDVPALLREVPSLVKDAGQRMMSRTQRDVANAKRRRIDSAVEGEDLASNYKRGGKAKRMGYAMGGPQAARMMMGRAAPARIPAPVQRPMMGIPRTPMRGMYAKGGAVTAGEAKKIAERTVGDHVRYKAPLGHAGLGKMIARRR